jgi:multidrug transporter EmrE-like cation transporter
MNFLDEFRSFYTCATLPLFITKDSMTPIIFGFISAVLFSLCDTISCLWGRTQEGKYLAIMLFSSPLGYLFFGYATANMNLGIAATYINVSVVLLTTLFSTLFFGEKMTLSNLFGFLLALFALYFLLKK